MNKQTFQKDSKRISRIFVHFFFKIDEPKKVFVLLDRVYWNKKVSHQKINFLDNIVKIANCIAFSFSNWIRGK